MIQGYKSENIAAEEQTCSIFHAQRQFKPYWKGLICNINPAKWVCNDHRSLLIVVLQNKLGLYALNMRIMA